MDLVGGFHVVEKDSNLFELVYHDPNHHSIPQIQSPTSSSEEVSDDPFLCPWERLKEEAANSYDIPVKSSPRYVLSSTIAQQDRYHHLLPLFWCNNKEFDVNGGCPICIGLNFGTDYYFCDLCDKMFHKECVQSPPKIKHPYHPEHSLQLYFHILSHKIDCLCCGKTAEYLVYYCTICEVLMHPLCAMKRISFLIDPPKRHDHPLTFFPRQMSLTCNVCGLLRKIHPTYICAICNFVAHNDCMCSPRIIKISRHQHRISYVSSLRSGESSCGVCRQRIDGDYGAYTCDKCSDYAVHSRCALGKDVWDGEDLEGVPEEDDITQDAGPFEIISTEVILYFLHDHHLKLEASIIYDEKKLCHACVLPIYEGNLYSCMECDFILHEVCANAPRRRQHALHPHPLTLKAVTSNRYGSFLCSACRRFSGGFVYECYKGKCDFNLDVRCALISEPFDYKGHEHPLFLSLDSKVHPMCHLCGRECHKQLNCIKCDFIVCITCSTLPYKARYKHDSHILTILCVEVREKDWCEVCERSLKDTDTKVFYWCNDCCTTFHIDCLLGEHPYLKLKLQRRG